VNQYDHLKKQTWTIPPDGTIYATFISQGTYLLEGFLIHAPDCCVITAAHCGDNHLLRQQAPVALATLPTGLLRLPAKAEVNIGICFGVSVRNQGNESPLIEVTPIGDYDAVTKEKWRTIYEVNGWKVSWDA
jgi:hypothetical protein